MVSRLSGLVTGTDWEAIVAKLMEIERRPLLLEQRRQLQLEAQRDAWRDVNSRMSTLLSTLDPLVLRSTFEAKQAASSDETIVKATAGADALAATHSVVVNDLADAQKVRSDVKTSATAALGLTAGTLKVGRTSFDAGATDVTIDVNANDTLNSIAEKINKTSGTISASVVQEDVAKYRLVLTARHTGADYAFNGTNTGFLDDGTSDAFTALGIRTTVGGPADANGNGFVDGNEISQAKNASATVDGIAIVRSTNEISDAVQGVTFNLLKKDPATTVTVTVSQDTSVATGAVKAFVEQYNSVYAFLKEKTTKDGQTGKPGTLQGDASATGIMSRLRRLVTGRVSGLSGQLDSLAQVGITTGAWGTADQDKLVFDAAKLEAALRSNPQDVMELFGARAVNVASSVNGGQASASSTGDPLKYNVADIINGLTKSDDFGSPGGGWQTGTDLATQNPAWVEIAFAGVKSIDQIKLWTVDSSTMPASSKGIRDFKVFYDDGGWKEIKAIAGNTAGFVSIDFAAVATSKIRIEITDSNDSAAPKHARLVEVEALQTNDGAAKRLKNYVNSLTSSAGVLPGAQAAKQKEIDRTKQRIADMEARLARKEEFLLLKFGRLEQALSRLRSQGQWISQQFGKPSLF